MNNILNILVRNFQDVYWVAPSNSFFRVSWFKNLSRTQSCGQILFSMPVMLSTISGPAPAQVHTYNPKIHGIWAIGGLLTDSYCMLTVTVFQCTLYIMLLVTQSLHCWYSMLVVVDSRQFQTYTCTSIPLTPLLCLKWENQLPVLEETQ